MDGLSSGYNSFDNGSEVNCELKGDRLDNDDMIITYDKLRFEIETRKCFSNCEAISAMDEGVINADRTPADSRDTWDGLDPSKKHYCLKRQMALDCDSQWSKETASDTDSDSDTDVDQKWDVDAAHVHKISTVKSQHPNLCSNGNTVQTNGDSCDVAETISNATGSSRSRESYKIRKRKREVLRINDGCTNLIEIETVKYTVRKDKCIEHYVTRLPDAKKEVLGDTGLSPKDLLLEVNGKSLENIKRKKVVKIFKKIKPNKKDKKISLTLVVRRWERDDTGIEEMETDYEIQLILEPERGVQRKMISEDISNRRKQMNRHRSFRVSVKRETIKRQETVPPGQVDNIRFGEEVTGRLKVLHAGPDVFITAGEEGNVLVVVPTEENREDSVFRLHELEGHDRSPKPLSEFIYMTRISPLAAEPKTYLMSSFRDNDTNLRFKESSFVDTSEGLDGEIDESVFIVRERGDEKLFESLLFRGYYISVWKDTGGTTSLQMVQKSDDDIINDRNVVECKFDFFKADRNERLLQVNSESFLERIFNQFFSCVGNRSSFDQRNRGTVRPILRQIQSQSHRT